MLIIGIITAIIGLILCLYEIIKPKNPLFMFMGCILITVGFILSVVFAHYEDIEYNKPTAIDVYRGKTTLQITYQDGIPVDSVVIFKEQFK